MDKFCMCPFTSVKMNITFVSCIKEGLLYLPNKQNKLYFHYHVKQNYSGLLLLTHEHLSVHKMQMFNFYLVKKIQTHKLWKGNGPSFHFC